MLVIAGSGKIDGPILGGKIALSGSMNVNGDIKCREAELKGSYTIKKNVECQDSFISELDSKCRIDGDLICGGDVTIEMEKASGRLRVTQIISQGNVFLEGVSADYVSGKSVKIGDDCNIGSVEENPK